MTTQEPQAEPARHLRHVADLASFSMLFRPVATGSEVIQFTRAEYTDQSVERTFRHIIDHLPDPSDEWSEAAAFVFAVSFDADHFRLGRSDGGVVSLVHDTVADRVADFSRRQLRPGSADFVAASPATAACPTTQVFDLLETVQRTARRYNIDERITPENLSTSGFVMQKQAMDYLYQNGVFGTFDER